MIVFKYSYKGKNFPPLLENKILVFTISCDVILRYKILVKWSKMRYILRPCRVIKFIDIINCRLKSVWKLHKSFEISLDQLTIPFLTHHEESQQPQ